MNTTPAVAAVRPGQATTRAALWMMMIGGGFILFLSVGTRQGFGVFQVPMLTELGWGREIFSIAIAIQNLVWGVTQPIFGALADRYGSGRVAAVGGVLYAGGLYLMATPGSPEFFYLGGGVVVGMALAAASFGVVLSAIGRAAPPERQGMAMGVASAIGSLGQFLMIPGLGGLVAGVGWSNAFLIAAVGVVAIVLLAPALRAPKAPAGGSAMAMAPDQSMGDALREAMGHSGYWLLMAGFFVCGFQITFIATHVPAYVETELGLSRDVANGTLAMIGLGNIVGSYVCSAAGDRYRRKYLLSFLYLARSLAIAALVLLPVSSVTALGFGLVMGVLWLGTVPLTTSLVGQIFGTRYMSMLFGIVFLTHQIGAGLGVWLGGLFYDATGSSVVVWLMAAALGVVAAILHWPISDRPVARLTAAPGAA